MNELYRQLNPNQQAVNPNNLKEQYRNFCSLMQGKNPNQILQQMIRQNPTVKNAISFMNTVGGDPKTAFYKLAEQKGINPNDILNQLR